MDSKTIDLIIKATDQASGVLNKVSGEMGKMGANAKQFIGDAVKTATTVATVGLAALTTGAVLSTKAFIESENAIAQTNAVLKSTGGVAGITAGQVTELATALQKQTAFSDEAIRQGENLLLTFTNIGKDIFPQATETILDMSTALGQDVKASAVQLGKALQDPIQGVTALRRVGVNFSEDQQKVIKNMVETGRSAEAQKYILAELNKEFGGSAKAAGETFGGQLAKLNNIVNDVMEGIGFMIAQALQPMVEWAQKAVEAIDWEDVMGRAADAVDNVREKIMRFTAPIVNFVQQHSTVILSFLKNFAIAFIGVTAALAAGAAIWGIISNPLVLIAAGVAVLITLFERFKPQIMGVLQSLKPVFDAIVQALSAVWNVISTQMIPALQNLWNAVAPVLLPVLKDLGIVLGAVIIGAIFALIGAIYVIANVITFLANVTANTVNMMRAWWSAFVSFFAAIPGFIAGVVQSFINFFANLPNYIAYAIGFMIRQVYDFATVHVPNAVMGIIRWFQALPGNVAAAASNMYNAAMNWFRNLGNGANNAGSNIVNGFSNFVRQLPGVIDGALRGVWNNIAGWAGGLGNKMKEVASSMWNSFKAGLGIRSPSYIEKAFMAIGKQSDATLNQLGQNVNSMGDTIRNAVPDSVRMQISSANVSGGAVAPVASNNVSTNNVTTIEASFNNASFRFESAEAVDAWFSRFGRKQELAAMGLATGG